MSTGKRILLSMYMAVAGLVLIMSISYFIANKEINVVMESDLNSMGNSLEKTVGLFAKQNPKGYEDEDFQRGIKDIKIGKTGYVFLMDSNGKLIVHQLNKVVL